MNGTLWITGASGFSGRHLIAHLRRLADRPRIVGIDLPGAADPGADVFHVLDVLSTGTVAALGKEETPRWVIHLAGAMPPASEQTMWQANVGGTLGLLDGLSRAGCRGTRVLAIGSAAEYLPSGSNAPLSEQALAGGASPYGRTKWAQTLLALHSGPHFGLATIVARPFNLIGPSLPSRLIAGWLCEQYADAGNHDEIVVGNLDSSRDFVDIRDAVEAYWCLVREGVSGEIYNVCSGTAVAVRRLIEVLESLVQRSVRVRVDPSRVRTADPPVIHGNPGKLRALTDWQPRISLERSLTDMIQALRSAAPCRS